MVLLSSLKKFFLQKRFKADIPVGITLLVFGISLFVVNFPKENILSTSFKDEPVRVEGFVSEEEGELPNRILISDLKIDLPVKPAKIINGYWEVFPDTAAWGEGSGLPGKPGNQVIFAHARYGLFLPLKSVKVGMKVTIKTISKEYTYEVKEIKQVYPKELEVIAPTTDETLTLYTCSGFNDTKRLIVIAKRI